MTYTVTLIPPEPPEFHPFPKIPRLFRPIVITEKIDGTNASVHVGEDGSVRAASRQRWITPEDDNFGFATWVAANRDELLKLGPGAHFGEWWGKGIQRNYGRLDRVFSLFNTAKWSDATVRPACCLVVPVLGTSETFDLDLITKCAVSLRSEGSRAQPRYMNPEGLVVFHTAGNRLFKYTLDGDGHKG